MTRPRISAKSARIVAEMDEYIRRYDICGDHEAFRSAAADPLDSAYLRDELDDLVRRRFLTVVRYGYDDSLGIDFNRWRDPRMCGTCWSVEPTPKMIRTFWPNRFRTPTGARAR